MSGFWRAGEGVRLTEDGVAVRAVLLYTYLALAC